MTKPIAIPDPKILCEALEEISGGTLLHQACSLGSSSVLAVFLNNFDGARGNNDGVVTKQEWDDYYTDLSMSTPSDEYFVRMMESTW